MWHRGMAAQKLGPPLVPPSFYSITKAPWQWEDLWLLPMAPGLFASEHHFH